MPSGQSCGTREELPPHTLWVDLVERATVEDVTLVCYERGDEATVRCHCRLLGGLLFAVARKRGFRIDPAAGELEGALLEGRRRRVLAGEG